jgi:tetratricopeptide (TPR) repeat protein
LGRGRIASFLSLIRLLLRLTARGGVLFNEQRRPISKTTGSVIVLLSLFALSFYPVSVCFPAQKPAQAALLRHYLRGSYYASRECFDKALPEFQKARDMDPQSLYIRLKIAGVLVHLGKMAQAEKELEAAKKIEPDQVDSYLALVFLYAYTNDDKKLDKAYEAFLKKASAIKPDDSRILGYLGQFYYQKHRFLDAVQVYKKITQADPTDFESMFWVGYVYVEMGLRQEAMAAWEETLKINPLYGPALNSLGYLYAEECSNLDKAETMVVKALSLEPDNGAYLDSLGWVYFKKKDYKRSRKYLEKALLHINDPAVYGHLGDLAAAQNDIVGAVKYYREGLKDFPDNEDLLKKINVYQKGVPIKVKPAGKSIVPAAK